VRRAWRLVQGIREGQELGALRGYQFERGLHDTGNDQFIDDFRALYPIVAHRVTAPVADEAADAVAARNVVDGRKLAQEWTGYRETGETTEVRKPELKTKWAARKLDRLLDLPNDANDAERALKTQLDRLSDTADAVLDLLTYESVYQQVQGNYERSAAALAAMNGQGLPPEPESIQIPAAGAAFTHRVCVFLQAANGGWGERPAVQTRATAEPTLARWFAQILGDMSEIGCVAWITAESDGAGQGEVERARQVVRLSDLRIDAIDFLYLCSALPEALLSSLGFEQPAEEDRRAGETELEARIKYFVRGQYGFGPDRQVLIDFGAQPQRFPRSFAEAIEVSRSVLPLLSQARYLKPASLRQPDSVANSAGPSGFLKRDFQELRRRATRACRYLRQLDCADFLALSRFGVQGAIPPSPMTDPDGDSRITAMQKAVQGRLKEYRQYRQEANELAKPSDGRPPDYDRAIERLMDAMKALFGKELVVLPTISAPGDHLVFDDEQLLIPDEERVRLWLQQAAQTHPPLRTLEDTLLATDAWRTPALTDGSDWDGMAAELPSQPLSRLRVAQLSDAEVPYWMALSAAEIAELAAPERLPTIRAELAEHGWPRGVLSLVCWAPEPLDLQKDLCGLVVDQWSELIPSAKRPTGLSFQYDGPNTQAPQALLLAVPSSGPGDDSKEWSLPELRAIVNDTLDLAKVRSVDVDALDETIGGLFPATLVPSDTTNLTWTREKGAGGLADGIRQSLQAVLKGDIEVKIADMLGHPVSRATISVGGVEATTGKYGSVQFSGISIGEQTVTASSPYYKQSSVKVNVLFSRTIGVALLLPLDARISGVVAAHYGTNQPDRPVANARLTLTAREMSGLSTTTASDAKGEYELRVLQPGAYILSAECVVGDCKNCKANPVDVSVYQGKALTINFTLDCAQDSGPSTGGGGGGSGTGVPKLEK